MNDQISRQKLIDKLNSYHYTAIGMRCGKKVTAEIIKGYHDHVIEVIESQPPADVPDTNVGKWIPCSERLPKEDGDYLVWYDCGGNETGYMVVNFDAEEGAFGCWHDAYDSYTLGYVDSEFIEMETAVAWMPLPEPYKGE